MTNITYILAKTEDAEILTKIAIKAKSYWNYPEQWTKLWIEDLTITPTYIINNQVVKLIHANKIVGFYSLEYKDTQLHIGHFWILPEYIGKGFGKNAFFDLQRRSLEMNEHVVEVISDPNAEGFYIKLGAKLIRSIETAIIGRKLNVLEFRF